MNTEVVQSDLKTKLSSEIKKAYELEDEWLILTLETSDSGKVYISPDTIYCGTGNSRELRGPRWRTLKSAMEFKSIGYGYVIAGKLGMTVLAKLIKDKKIPKGVVVHKTAIESWLQNMADVKPVLNSVQGFMNPSDPANRSIAARRPGSVQRKKLRQGKECHFCNTNEDLTLHHLIRREVGGATEEENLLVVCRYCHEKIHEGYIDDIDLVLQVSCKRIENLVNKITNEETNS